jgi:CheY-like chemotaxis protein
LSDGFGVANSAPKTSNPTAPDIRNDEQVSLDLMRATLRSIDIDIDGACFQDGRIALQKVDRHQPDAVVFDLMMPAG